MKLKEFYIKGLFELYNHTINFDSSPTEDGIANVIMIYGKNGVGKTTVLRMIDGLMTLNFEEFKKTKFDYANLVFSNNKMITVIKVSENECKYLRIIYKNGNKKIEFKLFTDSDLEYNFENINSAQQFARQYRMDLEKFSYEFIDTERLLKKTLREEIINDRYYKSKSKKTIVDDNSFLNNKIRDFIKDSQINNSIYFHDDTPDLFDKILTNIDNDLDIDFIKLRTRLNKLERLEKTFKFDKFKLFTDNWDYKKIKSRVEEFYNNPIKLSIISAYMNVRESRILELVNLASRLLVFENSLNTYLTDKKISINSDGFTINLLNSAKDEIRERELSTGEYHLLYLTILALCTRVKGSVIAIDEPEMSMHITWQRQLVKTLTTIASNASPQMIFATHSPDIAENYTNSLMTVKYE